MFWLSRDGDILNPQLRKFNGFYELLNCLYEPLNGVSEHFNGVSEHLMGPHLWMENPNGCATALGNLDE